MRYNRYAYLVLRIIKPNNAVVFFTVCEVLARGILFTP